MHLAVIMDGGGRYAAKRGLPRVNGYIYGTRAILDIIDACDELSLSCVSFYVSSRENLARGLSESLSVSSVYVDFIEKTLLPICKTRGYKLFFVGDFESLTPELMQTIAKANSQTINNRGLTIAFVFSYNGMQCIPGKKNRDNVIKEVYRVLKPGGVYIFTAHNRDDSGPHQTEWDIERIKWDNGTQDPNLEIFGDKYPTHNGEKVFVHFSSVNEMKEFINQRNFEILEHVKREDICEEREEVKEFSGSTWFWVIRKIN